MTIDDETQIDENIEDYHAVLLVNLSMRSTIIVMIIMIQILSKSMSLEILLNELSNLYVRFCVLTVWKIKILFTTHFSMLFAISLKIRKMDARAIIS